MTITHGMYKSRTYRSWIRMRQRCNDKNCPDYVDYGGRGITVCKRWDDFMLFYEDMGERPEGMSLDRRDGEKNYEPGNCRWATPLQQTINRKSTRWITFRGETLCLKDWATRFGLTKELVWGRVVKAGWPIERALTTPSKREPRI